MRTRALIPAALLAGGCVVVLTAIASAVTGKGIGIFTRDITTLCGDAGSHLPYYAGAISTLTGMVWASSGSLTVLVAYLVPSRRRWLLLFAAFLFILAADDALTLHETVGPSHGLHEGFFYLFYFIVAAVLLRGVLARPFDLSTVAFLLGGVLLATSGAIDRAFTHQYLVEDGAKLLGTMVWLTVPVLCLPLRAERPIPVQVSPRTPGAPPPHASYPTPTAIPGSGQGTS